MLVETKRAGLPGAHRDSCLKSVGLISFLGGLIEEPAVLGKCIPSATPPIHRFHRWRRRWLDHRRNNVQVEALRPPILERMSIGYSSPLYALPCDERDRLVEGVFGWREPLDARQFAAVASFQGVLYAGFRQAIDQTMTKRRALFIGNDRYGAVLLADAIEHGYLTALALERSGEGELEFEQSDLGQTLLRWQTTFGKVRLRFDANGDADANARVLARLRHLRHELQIRHRLMMIELTTSPETLLPALQALKDGGADPDIWILPPLGQSDAELAAALVRPEGRQEVSCLVRGHGGDAGRIHDELQRAATVPAYVGFSVDPDAFSDIGQAWRSGDASFADQVARVAERFGDWIECFRSARITYQASTGQPFFQS
jgi:myo-inositol catabolism protein IolC